MNSLQNIQERFSTAGIPVAGLGYFRDYKNTRQVAVPDSEGEWMGVSLNKDYIGYIRAAERVTYTQDGFVGCETRMYDVQQDCVLVLWHSRDQNARSLIDVAFRALGDVLLQNMSTDRQRILSDEVLPENDYGLIRIAFRLEYKYVGNSCPIDICAGYFEPCFDSGSCPTPPPTPSGLTCEDLADCPIIEQMQQATSDAQSAANDAASAASNAQSTANSALSVANAAYPNTNPAEFQTAAQVLAVVPKKIYFDISTHSVSGVNTETVLTASPVISPSMWRGICNYKFKFFGRNNGANVRTTILRVYLNNTANLSGTPILLRELNTYKNANYDTTTGGFLLGSTVGLEFDIWKNSNVLTWDGGGIALNTNTAVWDKADDNGFGTLTSLKQNKQATLDFALDWYLVVSVTPDNNAGSFVQEGIFLKEQIF